VAHAAERASNSTVGELSIVDGGDGASYTQAVAMYPAAVVRVLEGIGQVLGVDMAQLLRGDRPPAGAGRAVLRGTGE